MEDPDDGYFILYFLTFWYQVQHFGSNVSGAHFPSSDTHCKTTFKLKTETNAVVLQKPLKPDK